MKSNGNICFTCDKNKRCKVFKKMGKNVIVKECGLYERDSFTRALMESFENNKEVWK